MPHSKAARSSRGSLASSPHVAVLVSAATGWGRGIIRGISTFANHHGPWLLEVEPDGERRLLPRGWKGDGIIARLSTPRVAQALLDTGVPLVNVSSIAIAGRAAAVPRVSNDVAACGSIAARHLLERGFRNFAYVGLQKFSYVREHREAFANTLRREGFSCEVLGLGDRPEVVGRLGTLVEWLSRLPKPVGVLTWNNAQGRAVIHACRRASLFVPEDVAVLSGNDDPLLCQSCLPQLSAIDVATERIGEKAAELLHLMMQGRPLPPTPINVPPIGVIARQSTDALLLDNPALLQAIGFIREHATESIQVEDILRVVPVARRSLERFFQESLGRSPSEEIRRVRLERAKHLLSTTDMPVPKVAQASGFGTGEYLATLLRKTTGMTPLKYRAAARKR
ncbi:MAG: DNA-binding transcriptional regulator [Planctomycetia bacterium]